MSTAGYRAGTWRRYGRGAAVSLGCRTGARAPPRPEDQQLSVLRSVLACLQRSLSSSFSGGFHAMWATTGQSGTSTFKYPARRTHARGYTCSPPERSHARCSRLRPSWPCRRTYPCLEIYAQTLCPPLERSPTASRSVPLCTSLFEIFGSCWVRQMVDRTRREPGARGTSSHTSPLLAGLFASCLTPLLSPASGVELAGHGQNRLSTAIVPVRGLSCAISSNGGR